MGQEIVIPESFKQFKVPEAFKALGAADDNLSEGIGQSYGVVGYKGKVWSLRLRGQRHNILRPDDGTPSSYLDVIILGQAKQKSKSFYKAYDPNNSDGERPICSSIGGVTPDPDVTTKQAAACALCPRNEWKVNPQTGKKGRECTDYKRLAVLILPTQTKPLFGGVPLLEPVFLRVPPASLNSLAVMGDTMAGQGFHFSTYITRITFDPNESHPKMVFSPLQGLSDNEAPIILKMREDNQVGRIINGDVALSEAGTEGLAPASATATGFEPSGSAQAATQAGAYHLDQTALSVSTTVAKEAAKEATLSTSTIPTALVEAGFGGVNAAPPPSPPSSPKDMTQAQVLQADTGNAEESDDDLDARIAGLIQTQ